MPTQGISTVTFNPVSAAVTSRRFVELSSGSVQMVGTAGNSAIGVSAQASPASDTVGIPVAVFNGGIMEVEAGAAVAVDADVTADATGRAITSASGNTINGVALTAASAAGEIIEVLLTKGAAATA